MNILKRELRAGLKIFLLWTLGLFFLVFVGMIKFTGISGSTGTDVGALMNQFPKIVLAVFGMVGVDITTIGGYYSVLMYYVLICAAIYGVSIGVNLINREAVDKTYEFIFTKPRSRSYILMIKMISSVIYLFLFCILNYLFSIMALASLKFDNTIGEAIVIYSIVTFLMGILFLSLGAFVAVSLKKSEKGSLYGNLCFLVAFVVGTIYDMLENGGILKLFSPFKYFVPQDILDGKMDVIYVFLCIVATTLLVMGTFVKFERKDLTSN